jgi:hypothetical protein
VFAAPVGEVGKGVAAAGVGSASAAAGDLAGAAGLASEEGTVEAGGGLSSPLHASQQAKGSAD